MRTGVVGPVLRRLAVAALTVVGVAAATFFVLSAAPGDPLSAWVSPEEQQLLSPADVAALRARLGLDRPVWVQCLRWCRGLLAGDLGHSFQTRLPVSAEIGERLWPTVELNLTAFLLVTLIGAPLGWWAARRPGRRFDRWSSVVLLALYAAPYFWLALVLQNLLAAQWRILPLYGRTPPSGTATLAVHLKHLALPALCLAIHQMAFYARFSRNTVLGSLRRTHTLCARAAGVPEGRVFLRCAVRPALVPLAHQFGLLIPSFAAGAVLIENIFSWPGLGTLFLGAVQSRDIPVVMGLTTLAGVLTVAGSLVGDALAHLADPRLRTPGSTAP